MHKCNTNCDTPTTISDIKMYFADPFCKYYRCRICNKEFYKENGSKLILPVEDLKKE